MNSTRQRDRDMSYAAAYAYVADRHQKKDDSAKETLDRGLRDVSFKVWPYECMQYLRGDFSAEKLIQIAAGDTDKLTEAEYFIGAKLILDGKSNEARKYLNWVRDNGNKDFLEFKFANWELDNLPEQ
jgi:lipoprotein NlpI